MNVAEFLRKQRAKARAAQVPPHDPAPKMGEKGWVIRVEQLEGDRRLGWIGHRNQRPFEGYEPPAGFRLIGSLEDASDILKLLTDHYTSGNLRLLERTAS